MARSKNFALNKRDDHAKQVVSVHERMYVPRFEPGSVQIFRKKGEVRERRFNNAFSRLVSRNE